jgi:hypothetical protein
MLEVISNSILTDVLSQTSDITPDSASHTQMQVPQQVLEA